MDNTNRYSVTYSAPHVRGWSIRKIHAKTARAAAKVITDGVPDATVREVAKIVAHTQRSAKLVYSE